MDQQENDVDGTGSPENQGLEEDNAASLYRWFGWSNCRGKKGDSKVRSVLGLEVEEEEGEKKKKRAAWAPRRTFVQVVVIRDQSSNNADHLDLDLDENNNYKDSRREEDEEEGLGGLLDHDDDDGQEEQQEGGDGVGESAAGRRVLEPKWVEARDGCSVK